MRPVHFAVLAEFGQDLAGLQGVPPDVVAVAERQGDNGTGSQTEPGV